MKLKFAALSLVLGMTVVLGACQAPEEEGTTLPEETQTEPGAVPEAAETPGGLTQPGTAPGAMESPGGMTEPGAAPQEPGTSGTAGGAE
jgi:hypothetical protein